MARSLRCRLPPGTYRSFMEPPTRIDLHLRLHVLPGRRAEFLAFLREAIPFYESPGGITVRLLQDLRDDHRFIELVLYDDEAAYARDQERVADDPAMKAYLARWRDLLGEPPVVEVYRRLTP
jgi:quinol monooxygenase YgiN